MSKKINVETLIDLYNKADRMYDEMDDLMRSINEAGLGLTGVSLGVDDALKAMYRTMADLDRRIRFAKEEL